MLPFESRERSLITLTEIGMGKAPPLGSGRERFPNTPANGVARTEGLLFTRLGKSKLSPFWGSPGCPPEGAQLLAKLFRNELNVGSPKAGGGPSVPLGISLPSHTRVAHSNLSSSNSKKGETGLRFLFESRTLKILLILKAMRSSSQKVNGFTTILQPQKWTH